MKTSKSVVHQFTLNFAFLPRRTTVHLQTMRKVIIDTDCGLDDAMAIMLALAEPEVEVLAITCVFGNTKVDKVVVNVSRVLDSCDRKVKIYKGCCDPLLGDYTFEGPEDYHGEDGFGDVPDLPVPAVSVETEPAALALVKFVDAYPGQVTIVALGPLTNIALAVRLKPSFGQNVKELFLMGGNVEGLGNATSSAEANFWCDPEAAFVVLREMECPTILVPWETCLKHSITWERRRQLLDVDSKRAKLIATIEHKVEEKSQGLPGYVLCDQFAMAAMLYPEAVIGEVLRDRKVTVELAGRRTRGQMMTVVDRANDDVKSSVQVIKSINMDLFYFKLLDAFGHKYPS